MAEKPTPIELQKYLSGVDYPASRQDLVDTARQNGAPDDIVDALSHVDDESFDAPTAVSHALSGA